MATLPESTSSFRPTRRPVGYTCPPIQVPSPFTFRFCYLLFSLMLLLPQPASISSGSRCGGGVRCGAGGSAAALTNSHLIASKDGATRMGSGDQQIAGRGVHSPASSLLAAAAHSGSKSSISRISNIYSNNIYF